MSTKIRTLRGRIQEGIVKRIVVDDGLLTRGMRIRRFIVAPDLQTAGNDCIAVLGFQGSFPIMWDWSDNNQVAWSGMLGTGTDSPNVPFELVDRDATIVRDLYIIGQVLGSGGNDEFNYYIELELIDITEEESILQLIKERNQGVLRA